jgi:hypothetical protein
MSTSDFLNLLPASKKVPAEGSENAHGSFVHKNIYVFCPPGARECLLGAEITEKLIKKRGQVPENWANEQQQKRSSAFQRGKGKSGLASATL